MRCKLFSTPERIHCMHDTASIRCGPTCQCNVVNPMIFCTTARQEGSERKVQGMKGGRKKRWLTSPSFRPARIPAPSDFAPSPHKVVGPIPSEVPKRFVHATTIMTRKRPSHLSDRERHVSQANSCAYAADEVYLTRTKALKHQTCKLPRRQASTGGSLVIWS